MLPFWSKRDEFNTTALNLVGHRRIPHATMLGESNTITGFWVHLKAECRLDKGPTRTTSTTELDSKLLWTGAMKIPSRIAASGQNWQGWPKLEKLRLIKADIFLYRVFLSMLVSKGDLNYHANECLPVLPTCQLLVDR
jgi:hypothetical protein